MNKKLIPIIVIIVLVVILGVLIKFTVDDTNVNNNEPQVSNQPMGVPPSDGNMPGEGRTNG